MEMVYIIPNVPGQLSNLIEKERNQESSVSISKRGELTLALDGASSSALSLGRSSNRSCMGSGGSKRTHSDHRDIGGASQKLLRGLCLMRTRGGGLWIWLINKYGPRCCWAILLGELKEVKGEERERNEKQSPWFGFVAQGDLKQCE